MINQDHLLRNETNDIQEGAEYSCRHNLDTGWITPSFHMHPHFEIYLFIRGKGQMIIEDESFDIHPMDLFIFPPGIIHRLMMFDPTEPYERAYFYVTRRMLAELSEDRVDILQMLDSAASLGHYSYHAESIGERFVQLIDEILAEKDLSSPLSQTMNHCRIHMLSLLTCKTIQDKHVLSPRPPDRMSDVIRYINDHIQEPLSLDSLAEQFYLSKYTLLHKFKSYTNISVHQYILSKRLLQSEILMHRGMTPGDAAKQSGFNDYTGFYRAFVRSNSGLTPQEFYSRICQGKS